MAHRAGNIIIWQFTENVYWPLLYIKYLDWSRSRKYFKEKEMCQTVNNAKVWIL